MSEISTSGPIDVSFLTENEIHTSYEEMPSRGFNPLVKAIRQGRWFMLKGLKAELRDQVIYQEWLKKEYALMVQLDHPNIVKAYAKEVNELLGPCIVMEYVDGVTLDSFLDGNPSREARLKVLDQLTDALVYIHNRQIIHRDLKPSNILITRNGGNVKIIDFGLSDADDYAVLKQSTGTVKYMSPEQASGTAVDCRSDIYSFGLILKEIFPHRYRRIARKCTRKDPDQRFGSMEEVRKALGASDRRRRHLPYSGLVLLFAALLLSIRYAGQASDYPDTSENVLPAQRDYLEGAKWLINTSYNGIIHEAEEGKSYREVLTSKLSRLTFDLDARRAELSHLYQPDSPEQLHFITQYSNEQKIVNLKALKIIDQHLRSFEEEYHAGRIGQAAYDSLKWVVSPQVRTLPVSDISATGAVAGVELPGCPFSGNVRAGICWSACHNPTINCPHSESIISGLAPGSTYFVRGYVETGSGITYGNEVSFTTSDSTLVVPEGALVGLFTVAPGRQILFSRGNLRYRASTGTWRFADRQYDFVGKDNEKLSASYDGWIDLFGWATSGYDHGAVNYQPWSLNLDTDSDRLHYAYGKPDSNLYDNDGKADWGYNRIDGGGGEEHFWRTPRVSEWVSILFNRNTASGVRFAKARVADRNGLILLPDNWKVAIYPLNSTNDAHADYTANVVPEPDWLQILEPAGAVFLPEAGARTISGVFSRVGGYYTSEVAGSDAWHFLYDVNNLSMNPVGHRGDGLSVRLVRDAGEIPVL